MKVPLAKFSFFLLVDAKDLGLKSAIAKSFRQYRQQISSLYRLLSYE
tara:strand:+ start:1312 stop:1452 length:141 start_codon:yes stop_codon:yes gene_type:complete